MFGKVSNTTAASIKFDDVADAVKVIGYDAKRQPVSEAYARMYGSDTVVCDSSILRCVEFEDRFH
jgi:hypothetical protein